MALALVTAYEAGWLFYLGLPVAVPWYAWRTRGRGPGQARGSEAGLTTGIRSYTTGPARADSIGAVWGAPRFSIREAVLPTLRFTLVAGLLLMAAPRPAVGQQPGAPQDSARAQIRGVLRAFYLNLQNQNWDALAAYVLSPKLLERRGAPGDLQLVARDRTRRRWSADGATAPRTCPSSASPMIEDAAIHLDGDWADVAVPRCNGSAGGVDQFGMIYFEERWRFIYTDLFEASPPPETAAAGKPGSAGASGGHGP